MKEGHVTISLSLAWWVQPYLILLQLFVATIEWALDPLELEGFVERQCEFVTKHGIKLHEKFEKCAD